MTLTLRAVSLNNAPLSQPITAHFDVQGGTIGRSNQNTLSLPDPERFISRQHAEIVAVGKDYLIRNIGTSNPIMVRNQLLAQGESLPLAHHDAVRIGGYLLEVLDHSHQEVSEAATVLRGRGGFDRPPPAAPWLTPTGVPKTGPGSLPPELPAEIGSAAFELSPDNPFASLMVQAEAETPPRRRAPDEAGPALLPRDFDPFAPRAPLKAQAPAPSVSAAFDDLVPVARRSSIDDLIGPGSGQGHDPLASFLNDQPTPTTRPASFDMLPDRVPEMQAAFEPPRVRPQPVHSAEPAVLVDTTPPPLRTAPPRAVPPPSAPAPAMPAAPRAEAGHSHAGAAPTHDAQALWDAFCRGAELQPGDGPACSPETMAKAGTLLRLAVEGILQLMALRQTTRYELHAAVTMIRPRENNPLKFSPDAHAALLSLLQPPARGYLPGTTAMSDAMNDLVGHAMGTMAGTRAALDGVLGRFAPAELEGQLDGGNVLSRLLPMNRRSKLWELYLQHYQGIRDEAQEDFQTLFGKAFMAAYEQQLDRLDQQRRARESG